MSRIILTTCGTSIFQSSCWKYNDLNKNQLSHLDDEQDRRKHENFCESNLKEAMKQKKGSQVSASFDHELSWNDPECLRDLPAELASLRAIQIFFQSEVINKPLGKDDKVVLLHSNNKEGEFCAEILYAVLNNTEFNLLPQVNIEKMIVPGLDPLKRGKFGEALISVWKEIISKNGNELRNYIFNLTAGYKAIAILFGGIAYHIAKVPIFYLHEETGYREISFMCFNKEGDMEKWFYAGDFNIPERKFELEIGSSEAL